MKLSALSDASVGALHWHQGCWWWSDVTAPALKAWRGTGQAETSRLPEQLATFAFCRSGKLLLGLGKWLYLAELTPPGALTLARRLPLAIAAVDPAEARTGISDGCTDRHGNFVLGTASLNPGAPPIGSFYQFSRRAGLRRLALPTVAAARGIAFSPDGAILYFAGGDGREILQCAYDPARAEVDRVERFAELGDACVDGVTVDGAGCLWVALRGDTSGGKLARFAPDGTRLQQTPLPFAPAAARPAFGGPQLEQLAVGAIGDGLHFADAGGARGMPATLFDDGAD
ncbi:SMP-30/gluconolactonase/LRE family protein [Pseudoduganella violaceinigra]|uniref:SMP-30/gluconolactonase/LRE family protein n=1 Tax=Pseudoduganella violaceinigra TaxID=246602 RepID=UPI0012B5327F|nr:SMP-30/gluconolactonase/LRE family protein [Pseudoduganella violaceinigra]